MGNQRNCSGRGKNKKSISIPQVPSKEPGGEHQEAVAHTSAPRIPEAGNNLMGKQNWSRGSEQGQASKVVTTPIQQEQTIAEDVLVSIVSRLRLRDAVRTSVLSRRWRHIWTRIPVFIFDGNAMFDVDTLMTLFGENSLLTKKQKYELALQKTDQFITSVDSVLQQHQGDTIEEFVVYFYLHTIHSHCLDEWLRYAVAAKTKKLRVYLGQPFADIRFLTSYATQNLGYYLTRLHRNLPDLRSLSFHIVGSSKVTDLQKGSCSFIHLKHLDWTWNIEMKMSLLHLATLLDVAPFLEELKLHLQLSKRASEKTPQSLTKLSKMLPKQPHAHLKTVEISGFCCDKWQVEIALYLLSNATELESMTVEKDQNCSSEILETDINNLRQKVPANVNFVIV